MKGNKAMKDQNNILKENQFFINYINKMIESLKLMHPKMDESEIRKIVEEEIKKRIDNNENKIITIKNNYKDNEFEISLYELLDLSYNKNYIFTPYGTIFWNHENAHNLNSDFLYYLKDSRKEKKNLKFKAMNDGDTIKENFYDMFQLAFKLLMNSYYGITNEPSSQFFNEIIPASITYTGYALITTSIMNFEQFMANNIKITSFSNLINYINNIINYKKYNLKITKYIDKNKLKSKNDLLKFIVNKLINFDFNIYANELLNLVNGLSIEDINKIYYVNNIYNFIDDSTITLDIIKDILENNKTDRYEELWNILNNFITYPFQVENRYNRIHKLERRFILGCDTDSNFCGLNEWYKYIESKNIKSDEFNISDVAIYFLSKFINSEILTKYTDDCGIPDDKKDLINMKSEFLFSRMMFTRNKKQYAGLLIEQEGNILKEPKIDMKGLSIKKSNVCVSTKKFFTNLINEEILSNDNINLSFVLKKFNDFENIIRDSLSKGETLYLTPGKSNEIESYKLPYQMQSVRGTIIWNELYQDNIIRTPTKVNLLKLKVSTLDDLEELMDIETYSREYNIIKEIIFTSRLKKVTNKDNQTELQETNNLLKYGFEIIALPKSISEIPKWLLPLIDVDAIVKDNVSVGNLLLESLGFKLMNFNNQQYYSNFINF
jgi:hypothetical protein